MKTCRFSVGTVNVLSGNFAFFDNATHVITPEHVMASGALPPAFPATQIGTDFFWDGGIVSNTPLQHLLDEDDDINSLVFQVDLFSARGNLPRSMADVLSRHKDIMYSSRTRQNTDTYMRVHKLKLQLIEALKREGAGDILVVCGGVIPPKDYAFLKKAGVSAIYGPGTNIPKAASEILSLIRKHRLAA